MTTMLDLEIPAALDELAGARATVRTWLAAEGIDLEVGEDLTAVASELLLHAIVRAAGVGAVGLHGEHRPDGVRLTVRAAAAIASSPRAIALPADPLAPGAFGRRVVERCCDDVAIRVDDDGTTAECWRRLAPTG
jgi:hypothetical protein